MELVTTNSVTTNSVTASVTMSSVSTSSAESQISLAFQLAARLKKYIRAARTRTQDCAYALLPCDALHGVHSPLSPLAPDPDS